MKSYTLLVKITPFYQHKEKKKKWHHQKNLGVIKFHESFVFFTLFVCNRKWESLSFSKSRLDSVAIFVVTFPDRCVCSFSSFSFGAIITDASCQVSRYSIHSFGITLRGNFMVEERNRIWGDLRIDTIESDYKRGGKNQTNLKGVYFTFLNVFSLF